MNLYKNLKDRKGKEMGLTENVEGNNFYPKCIPEVNWRCDYLWSTHRGCSFDCSYCSSKRFNVRFGGDPTVPRRLRGEWCPEPMQGYLKKGHLPNAGVFLSPYNDIMTISDYDIKKIFRIVNHSAEWRRIKQYVTNTTENNHFNIIMQTKDPSRYFDYLDLIPKGSWLGTTIETDDILEYGNLGISKSPSSYVRYAAMVSLRDYINTHAINTIPQCRLFVTIEPVIKCSIFTLSKWIRRIKPELVFIGCDSGKNNLPEPTMNELIELIEQLKHITTVHVKSNAQRIIGDADSQTKK